jgi:hypothetical protein
MHVSAVNVCLPLMHVQQIRLPLADISGRNRGVSRVTCGLLRVMRRWRFGCTWWSLRLHWLQLPAALSGKKRWAVLQQSRYQQPLYSVLHVCRAFHICSSV